MKQKIDGVNRQSDRRKDAPTAAARHAKHLLALAAASSAGMGLGLGRSAHATTYTWDSTGASTPVDGSGNWDNGTTSDWYTAGAATTWSNTGNNTAVFGVGGTAGNVTLTTPIAAGALTFNSGGTGNYTITGNATNTLTLAGTTPTITTNAAGATISAVLAGSNGITFAGAGNLTLTSADTYTGGTSLSAGTLQLSGGNNRLLSTGSITFAGNSTLNVGSTSQTLATISVANNVGGTINGTGGTLTVTGSSMVVGANSATSATATLDLTNVSTFVYNNASGTFGMQGTGGGTPPPNITGVITLGSANSITANVLEVNSFGGTGAASALHLGQTNTIDANTITVGSNGSGNIDFRAGLSSPTVTIADAAGGATANMTVGITASQGTVSSVNLTGATANVSLNSLSLGIADRGTPASPVNGTVTGNFTMNAGTFQAGTVLLGQMTLTGVSGSSGTGGYTPTGIFNLNGGTANISTLTFADKTSTAANTITGNFTLAGGATLGATTLQTGNSASGGTINRNFIWNDGTIQNYRPTTETNLTINSGISIGLASTGNHTFDIDSGFSGTVNAVLADQSSGGTLTKIGGGTLFLAAANTYTGGTTISAGTLNLQSGGSLGNTTITLTGGNLTVTATSSGRTLSNSLVLNGGTVLGAQDNVGAGGTISLNSSTVTHTFTGNATLTLSAPVSSVSELIVGGGSAGGGGTSGTVYPAGGGGGQVLQFNGNQTLSSGNTAIVVGVGGLVGAGGSGNSNQTGINALGGVGGSSSVGGNNTANGGATQPGFTGIGATDGDGIHTGGAASGVSAGGGGGAGGNGTTSNGGAGVANTVISGLTGTYGGGGGGGPSGSGGSGGGGSYGSPGTVNTGGGGGGGGAGGSGIVIVQYAYAQSAGTVILSGNISDTATSTLDAYGSGGSLTASGNISGAGGINIASSNNAGGVVTFSGNNSYQGATAVNSGATLRANNGTSNGSATGTGNITLAAGSSGNYTGGMLGGGGNVTGTVTLTGNSTLKLGGIITAGASGNTTTGEGTLATGNQTWNGGGAYEWKITGNGSGTTGSGSTVADFLKIGAATTGSPLTITTTGGLAAFTIAPLGNLTGVTLGANGTTYNWNIAQIGNTTATTISLNGGNITGNATNNLLSNSANFALDTSGLTIDGGAVTSNSPFGLYFEQVGSNNDLVLTYNASPEPGTAMLMLAGAGPMLLRRRRRKRPE